jgi:hypothetical protein
MPKQSINYSNTIIYKLVCKDVDVKECYVGQTTNFSKRKAQHKCCCNNSNQKHYDNYLYQFIREHSGWNNWDMIEIEKYNANDKLEVGKRERHWIEQLQATLNKNIPTQTIAEWYNKHEHYNKNYYEKNKEQIIIQQNEYRERNKYETSTQRKNHYAQNREAIITTRNLIYQQNKDEINAKRRVYREKNKERINQQMKLYKLKKLNENNTN